MAVAPPFPWSRHIGQLWNPFANKFCGEYTLSKMKEQKLLQDENLPASLTCSICLGLKNDPVCTGSCQHTFCKACLTPGGKCINSCPLCRAQVGAIASSIALREWIDSVRVHCPRCRESVWGSLHVHTITWTLFMRYLPLCHVASVRPLLNCGTPAFRLRLFPFLSRSQCLTWWEGGR